MLLDSGSKRSYVTMQLDSKLKLSERTPDDLCFWEQRGEEKEFEVYQLGIRNKRDLQSLLEIEILDTDLISGISLRVVSLFKFSAAETTLLKTFRYLKGREKKYVKIEESENNAIVVFKFQKPSHIILLQTCFVIAQSRSKTKSERILIDSGSKRSYVTMQLDNKLKPSVIRKERLTTYAFGRKDGGRKGIRSLPAGNRNKRDLQSLLEIEILDTDLISGISL
ncbi:hypothetical protein CEXT_408701 [Caerostris extrusa]|uniref:Peptidase aspartic putative domain-containing protein n=1 Tax=Caerostris extrusa TaxID=172846 RepID=A0AAV4QDP6_CAEEX|nr:hypothetical protein CEXT_408701 [Caerostris extrusa]